MQRILADDGEDIWLRVTGEGPPLVLLHEWASSHRIWEAFAHQLAPHFTVYRWDARGHGGHPQRTSTPPSLERMADDLANLIAHFDLQAPTVVGHSMGALTAWAYIGRHGSARIGRLCVLDQSPKLMTDEDWRLGIYGDWSEARDKAFLAGLQQDFAETIVQLVANGLNQSARARYASGHAGTDRMRTYLRSLDKAPMIAVWPSLSQCDLRPVLGTIECPTLLIYGDESNFYPPPTGPYLASAIPNADLIIYTGADHSPHVNQPARFVDDLARFVLGYPLLVP
ncbi:MAG: alpha/beta hydrolase [Rhodospirillales bacterium]|nr:alpha/beta hydrolase [Rhodospirillales bacterium]